MILRFVTEPRLLSSGARKGVLATAYDLKRGGQVSSADERLLISLLDWFEQQLPVPTRFSRTRSQAHYRRTTTGIARFKSSATIHLEKMRELVELLDRYDIRTEIVKSERPGYVVYEYEYQVIAEPFRDTRT
jgi:hypothetical protein